MNIRKHLLLFIIILLLKQFACAQNVSVDPLTGSVSAGIPIYTVGQGQVSVPVSLVYSTAGIKTKDEEGSAGMGWQLQAGGQVSRVVKGLPDDCTKDNAGNSTYGWMSSLNTAASAISGFTIQNNGSTCSYETADISYITGHFPYTDDTEPDMFYVSAPGLSAQLVFNRADNLFHPVAYQDLVISYTTDPTSGLITTFTITNDKGIKYVFANPEPITQKTYGTSPTFFKTKFQQYQNGITYNSSWDLTSITDAQGNGVLLNYLAYPQTTGADSVALYLNASNSYTLEYRTLNISMPSTLSSIYTTNNNGIKPVLTFTWNTLTGGNQTGQTVISTITGAGHTFTFTYSPVICLGGSYTRSFLRNFSDPGCSSPINYQFSYIGEAPNPSLPNGYTTILPDSASTQRDYWGYYSTTASSVSLMPKVWIAANTGTRPPLAIYESNTGGSDTYPYSSGNGNSRAADPSYVMTGALNKIVNVQGASTNIFYESNDYLDGQANVVVQGSGIRVKQIIDSTSHNATNNIVRNYSYLNPSGVSSGEPVTLPQFAFILPYSGTGSGQTFWNVVTAISAYDLSTDDHTVMYSYSKVSQTGAGSTVYQYDVPATYWMPSASPDCSGCTTEWYPTMNYVGRTNCSLTYGPILNNVYSYPFIPNPNYDFERGLPLKITNYNDANGEVSETNYTYTRSYSPSVIYGVQFDNVTNGTVSVETYNKYPIYYSTSELTATVNKKIFDSSNSGTSQSGTITYTYGSLYHKLLTQQSTTNSDGSTLTTYTNYVKDYPGITTGTNANINALYNLQQLHINAPIESYHQVTRSGSTTTTAASLALFSASTNGTITNYLPSEQLKWVQPVGGTYTPMSISGSTLTYDGAYTPAAKYLTYDNTGFPVTVSDGYTHEATTLINHNANQAIATFNNAAYHEIAFSDFDTDQSTPTGFNFTISGTESGVPSTSHAGNAYSLSTGQTVSAPTITRNPTTQNYIFSIWVDAATGTNTLNISLNGGTAVPYTYTGTGNWAYYEWSIPVTTTTFTFSFTSAQNVAIDDILLYPDVATATTATYDPVSFYKLAATNTNGVSSYFTNDTWGRVLYAFDQDKNIVQKNTFLTPADIQAFSFASISAPATVTTGTASGFAIIGPDACSSGGATVTWNFGDTTTTMSALTATTSHAYNWAGTKSVTATINSPTFGTFILGPVSIQAVLPPLTVTYNNYTYSNGNITSVTFTNQVTGGPNYSFTAATLNNAKVVQGKYTVMVTLSGGTKYVAGSGATGSGYGTINLTGDCYSNCATYSSSNTYTFSVDLTYCTGLNFSVLETLVCGS